MTTSPAVQTCLVADDSAVIRKVARRILEVAGYAVAEAEDGDEALSACAAAMPDAILLDGTMPGRDGLGVLQALRAMPGGGRPKVMFCTSENDVGTIMRAMRAGADAYILKPFDREILLAKLEEIGLAEADAA